MTDATGPSEVSDGGPFIVCPACDTVQREPTLTPGFSARCRRCGRVLFTSRRGAMNHIVSVAATSVVLMACAIFLPFIEIETRGLTQRASLLDTVLAYGTGLMAPLVFALAALIIVLPTLRLLLLIHALGPLVIRHPPVRSAGAAFRLAEAIRPWAMAEVFLVGAAVALVKVGDLAQVVLGPAFWAIVTLVLLNLLNDRLICRFTVWKSLEARRVT
jgi:paraquat-inducible protein A